MAYGKCVYVGIYRAAENLLCRTLNFICIGFFYNMHLLLKYKHYYCNLKPKPIDYYYFFFF